MRFREGAPNFALEPHTLPCIAGTHPPQFYLYYKRSKSSQAAMIFLAPSREVREEEAKGTQVPGYRPFASLASSRSSCLSRSMARFAAVCSLGSGYAGLCITVNEAPLPALRYQLWRSAANSECR